MCLAYYIDQSTVVILTALSQYCSNKRSNSDPCSVLCCHSTMQSIYSSRLHFLQNLTMITMSYTLGVLLVQLRDLTLMVIFAIKHFVIIRHFSQTTTYMNILSYSNLLAEKNHNFFIEISYSNCLFYGEM